MDNILFNISVVIQIIVFVALIALIFSLTKIIKGLTIKVESLQDDFTKFKVKVDPLIDETLVTMKKVNSIAQSIDENLDGVKGTVDKVRNTVENLTDFVEGLRRKVEPSIYDTVNGYSAVVQGVKAFIERLKSTGNKVNRKTYNENLLFEPPESSDNEEYDFEDEFKDINKELNEVRKKLEEMKKV